MLLTVACHFSLQTSMVIAMQVLTVRWHSVNICFHLITISSAADGAGLIKGALWGWEEVRQSATDIMYTDIALSCFIHSWSRFTAR